MSPPLCFRNKKEAKRERRRKKEEEEEWTPPFGSLAGLATYWEGKVFRVVEVKKKIVRKLVDITGRASKSKPSVEKGTTSIWSRLNTQNGSAEKNI